MHGRSIVRTGTAAGVDFVGAIDPFQSGADLGQLTDLAELAGVRAAASPDALDWEALEADIAIVAITAAPAEVVDVLESLLRRGVDVITIVEDMYDLRLIDPALHERLDATAKSAGRTVVATGSQDISWGGIAVAASGLVRGLRSIELAQHVGVDGYPEEFVRWVGIGATEQEWRDAADVAGQTPSVFGGILPTIARALGLEITGQQRQMEIFTLEHDVHSQTFGRVIPAGQPAGRKDTVTLQTAQQVTLTAQLVTSVVMGQDTYHAEISGENSLRLDLEMLPAPPSVDATLVNRIPDVLAAAPGIVATTDLPLARYRQSITVPQRQAAD